jgi:hypothetical protein
MLEGAHTGLARAGLRAALARAPAVAARRLAAAAAAAGDGVGLRLLAGARSGRGPSRGGLGALGHSFVLLLWGTVSGSGHRIAHGPAGAARRGPGPRPRRESPEVRDDGRCRARSCPSIRPTEARAALRCGQARAVLDVPARVPEAKAAPLSAASSEQRAASELHEQLLLLARRSPLAARCSPLRQNGTSSGSRTPGVSGRALRRRSARPAAGSDAGRSAAEGLRAGWPASGRAG